MVAKDDAPRALAIIVAIARNGVIGRAGGLPFDWPEDRAYFEEKTRGHVVVMSLRANHTPAAVHSTQITPPSTAMFPHGQIPSRSGPIGR